MKMQMDTGDIIRDYENAKNKFAQVKVLAELNCVSNREMAQFLKDNGCKVDCRYFPDHFEKKTEQPEPETISAPEEPEPEWLEPAGIVIDFTPDEAKTTAQVIRGYFSCKPAKESDDFDMIMKISRIYLMLTGGRP